jgi:HTH-type transcriptional regulator/antitoxin HipB
MRKVSAMSKKLPSGDVEVSTLPTTIRTVQDLGQIIQSTRKEHQLTQIDVAGLAGRGNRFIVDLEKGKSTIQMQKAMEVLTLLGLELVIRKKAT